MRVTKEQAETIRTAQKNQQNEELYNNHDKELCSDCGYIKGGTACRKKCNGETGGRYSWLFLLALAILTYLYLQ